MLNSGQICMSTERVLVHRDVAEELQAELSRCMDEIKDKKFEIVRPGSVQEVQGIVSEAVQQVNPQL
jgi:acyl-CoA reductase-like NAD-dependent aldehyde dehydrogenase